MIIGSQKVIKSELIAGGNTSDARKVFLESGAVFFCKQSKEPTTAFLEEARGLSEIALLKAIRCPEVIEVDDHKLVLEWIEPAQPSHDFWKNFGFRLARMHVQLHEVFGFPIDNHIGTTLQRNPLVSTTDITWARYFIEHRLRPLLTHSNLAGETELLERFAQAEPLLEGLLLEVKEPPSLLHGDLWSGNFLCAPDQMPVLIDPAPYYGHREADLAMTELFGGFQPEFYAAYRMEFPVQPGYERRRDIYNLYHRLNHWVIFGESYKRATLDLLKPFSI